MALNVRLFVHHVQVLVQVWWHMLFSRWKTSFIFKSEHENVKRRPYPIYGRSPRPLSCSQTDRQRDREREDPDGPKTKTLFQDNRPAEDQRTTKALCCAVFITICVVEHEDTKALLNACHACHLPVRFIVEARVQVMVLVRVRVAVMVRVKFNSWLGLSSSHG